MFEISGILFIFFVNLHSPHIVPRVQLSHLRVRAPAPQSHIWYSDAADASPWSSVRCRARVRSHVCHWSPNESANSPLCKSYDSVVVRQWCKRHRLSLLAVVYSPCVRYSQFSPLSCRAHHSVWISTAVWYIIQRPECGGEAISIK